MRISTNTQFESSKTRMTNLQAQLDRTTQQLGADKKLLSAGDDPAAAVRAFELRQSASSNDQYTRNRNSLRNSLTAADSVMSGMVDALQTIHEQVMLTGNDVLSDAERAAIAQVLQGQYDDLLSLANSQDGSGNYMFAGLQTTKPPFVADANGRTTYQGDLGQQLIPVDGSRKMAMNEAGGVLLPDENGSNIFDRLKEAIAALQPDQTASSRRQAMDALGSSFQSTFSSMMRSQTSIGTRLNELDQLDTQAGDRALQIAQASSGLQDLDYAAALSDLSRQQLTLQAAQKSFQQVSNLSLFNYIS